MDRLIVWVRRFIQELRRRRVIRVAVVYATTGFVILQLAEILVDPFGLGPRALRLITLVLILGFPLAVGLAWVFNVTEEGLVRAEAEAEGEIGPEGKPLTSNGIIIGLLAVAVGLLLYPRVFSSSGGQPSGQGASADTAQVEERSIAVLPFEPLSSGEESKTFARGAHDDLLTRLANISDLKVISRTAVQQYRETDLTTGQIADSLSVRWVMEGGVQVLGDQIQVNAQLIDPRTETHAWASDYRRDLTAEDLFAIQGEITREIASALKAKLTASEQQRIAGAPTENLNAYRLYVRGRELLTFRRPDSIQRARRYFKQALNQDSSFARAWVGLADARVLYANHGAAPSARADSVRAAIPEAKAAARRALKLSPDLAEAHASLGHMFMYEGIWLQDDQGQGVGPPSLQRLKQALALKPSYADAQHWLGTTQLTLGRREKALEHLRLAVELSPEHRSAARFLTSALLANGKYKAALAETRRRQGLYPDHEPVRSQKCAALIHLKRWKAARTLAEKRRTEAKIPPSWTSFCLALADAATGSISSARSQVEKLEGVSAAVVRAAIGEVDGAFKALPVAGQLDLFDVICLRFYYRNLLSAFRADPRYEALIRKINEFWGLGPDGSIPDSVDTSFPSRPEDDA